jgi:hypothetical protein
VRAPSLSHRTGAPVGHPLPVQGGENVNLLEGGTPTLVKLYNDSSGRAYDLRRFKNEVMREIIKGEYSEVLRQTLGEVGFDRESRRR